MSALARWCASHRFVVLGGWIAAAVVLIGLVAGMGTDFKTVADLPNSESAHAATLLTSSADSHNETTRTGRIVWQTSGESVDAKSVQQTVAGMLTRVEKLPGVESVTSPYGATESAQLSRDHNTAYANVAVTGDVDVDQVLDVAQSIQDENIQVAIGGSAFAPETKAGGIAEIVGILAALLILLLMFRSAWAAVLPIITGVAGVLTSLMFVMVASHVVDLSSDSITMGSLIGLGVGIDYALFIVNRHRKALLNGASVNDAIEQAQNTSGRAVIFAGLTVIAALLAMFIVHMGVLTGMGRAAAVTVLFTVLAAITLLPALLAILGPKVLSKKQRRNLEHGSQAQSRSNPCGPAAAWARTTTRFPKPVALIAVVILAALAIPTLSMRVGEADSSTYPTGSVARDYSTMVSPAFGSGLDAPLVLVAQTPNEESAQAFTSLADRLSTVSGVAAVSTVTTAGDGLEVVQVTPTTNASDKATSDLVSHLRDDVVPAAAAGSDLRVYIGGETVTNIDVAHALMSKLPLYLVVVAVLGFLLLVLAFRSLLLPLVGALSNLATIAVGLGVLTAIFQWGWGSELLGVGTGAPISYIVPVMIVGVMFGLSMDYQVFLVSRMHEEWVHTRDNDRAIRTGLGETAKVIVTAAAIMLCVFSSFGFSGQRIVSCIGIGLALSVVVDALVVRMMLMPALMRLIGDRVWAYPRWADRITPHVSVEGAPEPHADLVGGTRPDGLQPVGGAAKEG